MDKHAESLASEQPVSDRPIKVARLTDRLTENAQMLLSAYRQSAQAIEQGQSIAPAAEWLLDNYHLVEQQLRQIRADLPPGYYRQLPKLAVGPFAGYPRVLGIAWGYVAHTDSLVSADGLSRFLIAYQRVQPLTIGELWAVAITLRIVLVENMRRLAVQITQAQVLRVDADMLVDAVLGTGGATAVPLHFAIARHEEAPLPEIFAAQVAKRLRGFDPAQTPLQGWLEGRLAQEHTAIDTVVQNVLQRQGASNVTMRNIINSMRLISDLDWADLFEAVSPVDAELRTHSGFAEMDFATRNRYRTAIEDLARGSPLTEIAITQTALALAAAGGTERDRDPGHALIGGGRRVLEQAVGFRPTLWQGVTRRIRRMGLGSYITAIALLSILLVWLALPGGAVALALVLLVPASDAATACVNLWVTRRIAPKLLPGLELAQGIPAHLRTLVAVPVLLSDAAEVAEQIERLEVHYLASVGGAVHYALVSDGPDAASETIPADRDLIAAAQTGIARLNARYPSEDGDRFLVLHRRRLWNPSEDCWMGWERKRGKLTELNRLLRGATDTSFLPRTEQRDVPPDVRFVITLDADTRLPRDTVRRLVGKMAHPLNRARFDSAEQRVREGYGILQPRVTPTLPIGREGSVFQRVFSSPGGIEPYAAAVSDVYQDLFDEGSFTGKGIYDVDAFEAALQGRVPQNSMLSHDLFEGIFARAALASDIEVIEEFPARYDVAVKRTHRWVRGDWQLLPWLVGRRRHAAGPLPAVGRWKIADNLRRSLVAPAAFAALVAGWLLPLPAALAMTGWVVGLLALPRLLPLPFALLPGRTEVTWRSHVAALGQDAGAALAQIGLNLVFLPDTVWRMGDAVVRTLIRLTVTRKRMLEWVTAAQAGSSRRPGVAGAYRQMAGGVAIGTVGAALAVALNPPVWPLALAAVVVWALAPAVAERISRPPVAPLAAAITDADVQRLRQIARQTWRYFETFVTGGENHLPPDNFQETPKPVVAGRTSPTNIGLYLLATVAARDMGWIGEQQAIRRLEQTLFTMHRLQKFRGHLFNWYDTRDLRVLDPAYVSSVDSGNLAGHLIAVAQACREWRSRPVAAADLQQGLADVLALAQRAAAGGPADLVTALRAIDTSRHAVTADRPADIAALTMRARDALQLAQVGDAPAVGEWVATLIVMLDEFDTEASGGGREDADRRLDAIAVSAQDMAMAMDFAFLLDPDKKLLSIGFNVATNSLDANCYDLLASEARLASLFAIAKGDVETRHWFRLGRAATPLGASSALISWSGSMFEYLMPSLVMRAPEGSLLAQTNRLVVARQQDYARSFGLPWGISESSYNARDLEMTYQYSNFGVPGLGLKRGLRENRVIAPYATGLASMVDPAGAVANYDRLAALGAEARYGFYEAVDFTPSRLPAGQDAALVRSFMAHHQGMTITAIANTVQDGRLRARFHAVPMIQAADLLLQERVPRDASAASPRAAEVQTTPIKPHDAATLRAFDDPAGAAPTAHLLSNGRYGVMLTPTGSGSSRWGDMAVTRWRPDSGHQAPGSFVFARDVETGAVWSPSVQPLQRADAMRDGRFRAVFSEHHAAFSQQDRSLTTMTDIVVSAEDDAEARRVTLTNTGRRAREIEVTSYAELVLAPAAAELAHPAFSKMFVVTDFLPELGVIIATRRRRAPTEPEVWAAHIAVVEGRQTAELQLETDRARFLGRGHGIGQAAMLAQPLSGTTGTVLDPVFSLRRTVSVPPGGRARITFWTMVAGDPQALLDLVDRHGDASAYARAATLAWTQAQVQLRHLGITGAEAADFQRLAGVVLRDDARLRASPARIAEGAGPQSGLWAHGISGDLPLVLLRVDDVQDIAQVREALSAHEYWRARQMAVDLVILNERAASYVQDLQLAVESAVRSSQTRPRSDAAAGPAQGAVHMPRADMMTPAARAQLLSVARVVLVASRGSIGQQLDTLAATPAVVPPPPRPRPAPVLPDAPDLAQTEFFNGFGGFAAGGREYVTHLRNGETTPAPWINVIANPGFGFIVSADGSGPTWAENSRENQLTPWSNDPVSDPPGEAIFLRDLDSGEVWTPTGLPIRGPGLYTARHGFGYSRFSHEAQGIGADMVQFVPVDDPVKITRLTLRNRSNRVRRLMVTAYAEWVLGTSRTATAPHIVTEMDASGAILAKNPFATAFAGRVAFLDIGANPDGWTGDRRDVVGAAGSLAEPVGLNVPLSRRTGAALDPCAALQREVTLAPGAAVEVIVRLGQAPTADAARELIGHSRGMDPARQLSDVTAQWDNLLGAVQITTPDRAMDVLLNGWLLYQTLACRVWARAGFYQASGAYGFRDQLQDGMALTFGRPAMTREHLLRAAARQFPEGDVQHWWLPHSGQGVRTRISDDRVWLSYGVATYIARSGDAAILDEQLPWLEGPALAPGAHDDFALPGVSEDTASLFEHCARGLDQAVAMTGDNGMPLIGTGDWNDGMNRVGEGGRGTSVWLGWLLIATLRMMAPLAETRDPSRAARWLAHAESVRVAIEAQGWDGEWYRRGTFDDGSLLGSATSQECRIDSIAQSWAVLSCAADPVRAAQAMASMTTHLIRPDPGLALLFTPPFESSPLDPGYIKGYPAGLRENGGQYSHAAMWAVMAHAKRGDGDAAAALFSLLNPVNHALTRAAAERYKVEPYVIAADVYSTAPHEGRGGWTWYTGSAGWMYRAGIEGILGLTLDGGTRLLLDPCFPRAWPQIAATVSHGGTRYQITVENTGGTGHGVRSAEIDGRDAGHSDGPLVLPLDGGTHRVRVRLG